MRWMLPASRSTIAGPPPLYGDVGDLGARLEIEQLERQVAGAADAR